jgi:hypothetical protein
MCPASGQREASGIFQPNRHQNFAGFFFENHAGELRVIVLTLKGEHQEGLQSLTATTANPKISQHTHNERHLLQEKSKAAPNNLGNVQRKTTPTRLPEPTHHPP